MSPRSVSENPIRGCGRPLRRLAALPDTLLVRGAMDGPALARTVEFNSILSPHFDGETPLMAESELRPDGQYVDRREFLETCTIIIGTASIFSVAVFQGCGDASNPIKSNDYDDMYA